VEHGHWRSILVVPRDRNPFKKVEMRDRTARATAMKESLVREEFCPSKSLTALLVFVSCPTRPFLSPMDQHYCFVAGG